MAQQPDKRVLVADADAELVKKVAGFLSRSGFTVKVGTSGAEALAALDDGQAFDLVITALSLPPTGGMEVLKRVKRVDPATPVVILTSEGSVSSAVEAMKQGAADFLLKPVTAELMEELASRFSPKTRPVNAGAGKDRRIVTEDPRMAKLLEMARQVADSRATVLISGESGTGKELFARFLHESSGRASGPFVAVNCAALPESLLESELFGHEKGAFTGAIARKQGKFELANHGTMLLDEISEMDIGLQAKLLRVLQEGEIDRVGGKRPIPVDVRVVATTNRDLKEHIEQGEFREDLFYRLNVIPLKIPPLRERPGDVILLAEHFLARFGAENKRAGLSLGEAARKLLTAQAWPGNVRELMNTLERAVLLAEDDTITPAALMFEHTPEEAGGDLPLDLSGMPPTLRDAEKVLIGKALEHTDGNRTHAAKILGISVRTLRNKLNEYKAAHV